MGAYFELKSEDVQKLQQAIQQYGGNAEKTINELLNSEVKEIFIKSITNLIPVSEKGKIHAKTSNPLRGDMKGNLTLYIHTNSKFHYLYFPDEGEGTSKGKGPDDFMGRGIDAEYDNVMNRILEKLQNEWR